MTGHCLQYILGNDTSLAYNGFKMVVEGGLDEGSGILKWIGLTVLGLIVLAILGGVFVFFFVEFEDEYDEDLDMAPEEEADPRRGPRRTRAAGAAPPAGARVTARSRRRRHR